jgi:hypothetical protein
MISIALRHSVAFMIACTFIAGCSERAASPDFGIPGNPADTGSAEGPASAARPQPETYECDLGVLPEHVQQASPILLYSGSAAAVTITRDRFAFDGDRLYVLTHPSKLSIIDSTDLDHLTLLSQHELPFNAIQLFPNGDTLWVLSGPSAPIEPERPNVGVSRATAFDVSDPAELRELGSTIVLGVVDDAQRAGNVVYIVSNEHPGCRDCTVPAPPTVVTTIALDEPSATRPRSQLRLSEPVDQWTRSNVMLLTEQRMYVAGPQTGDAGPIGSTIHVVDITAADGSLRLASELNVAGTVEVAWQLDERDGVLRVVSVDGAASSAPLVLQTFATRTSDQLEPMGRLALPLNTSLDTLGKLAGRFDATHAYLAAESGDVLLTVDLSDPSAPKQVGRVQLDSTLTYLDVRDNRLFALTQREGPLGVALLDIADPAAPALRSQIEIPNASTLDKLHLPRQSLELSADGKLLVVPYGARESVPGSQCDGRSVGGVQLISVDSDALRARGMAGSVGSPQRAIVRDERIVSFGDQYIESYAVAEPDAPQLRSRLKAQDSVRFVAQLAGNVLARVTQSYTDVSPPQLEIVENEQAADPSVSLGGLSLLDALTTDPEVRCQTQLRPQAMSARDTNVYVAYESNQSLTEGNLERRVGVLVIDASTPSAPRIAGKVDWVPDEKYETRAYIDAIYRTPSTYVWRGSTLLMLERNAAKEQKLRIIDLSEPDAPHVELLPLRDGQYVQLWVEGDHAIVSRYEQQTDARVRFFADRIDISDPRAPLMLPTINTPGALLSLDPETNRAISYCWHYAPLDVRDACPEAQANTKRCVELRENIQLVELTDNVAHQIDASELPVDIRLRAVARSGGAHFLAASRRRNAALIAIPSNAENIAREHDQLDLRQAGLSGPVNISAQAEHIFVSSIAGGAAWVAYKDGMLELRETFSLSGVEQLDVSERGAALAKGSGAQWLPIPE